MGAVTDLRRSVANALALTRLSELSVRVGQCAICGPTAFLKLSGQAIAVRCLRCRASAIHMGFIRRVVLECPNLRDLSVYEMSARGPVWNFLRTRAGNFACSEFLDGVTPGAWADGTQCQDVERLTFQSASFDLCTSTEVFEHVADDLQGFREICRVLRPGGRLIFTVPLSDADTTVERAVRRNGVVEHILEPEYHGDALRGQNRVLCFRNYGTDILQRLRACGFSSSAIETSETVPWPGFSQRVVVARKGF